MNEAERRRQLEEAVRDAVAGREPTPAEARTARHGQRRERIRLLVLVTVLGWLVIAWLWSSRPEFFFGPSAPVTLSPAKQEATLRFAMYLQRRRVEEYVARRGRLPTSLAQAGMVEDSVSWQRTDEGYVLSGRYGSLELQLPSRADADSFLGNALTVLRE